MVNWSSLISRNQDAVLNFAVGTASAKDFQNAFKGSKNPARCVLRDYGTTYGRNLARKALRRRGVSV